MMTSSRLDSSTEFFKAIPYFALMASNQQCLPYASTSMRSNYVLNHVDFVCGHADEALNNIRAESQPAKFCTTALLAGKWSWKGLFGPASRSVVFAQKRA
jgi:hypothetical protein